MTPEPMQLDGESNLRFFQRYAEWYAIHQREVSAKREEMKSKLADIDSALKRSAIQNRMVSTKQAELDRRSMHELAANNPVLRRMIRLHKL
jgi:hypothetical protein